MDTIELRAPAKINLFLKVLGKRDDGYHDIFSWFQAIDLFDYLAIEKAPPGEIALHIEGSANLPADDSNIVIRAARLMITRFRLDSGLKIRLKKNIPVAAGLGGGSSDAASTILATNRLFNLGLDINTMEEIGLLLGSDVPFFFTNGQTEVTGRGEKLRAIVLPVDYSIILVCPPLAISTTESYAALKMDLTSVEVDIKLKPCNNFKGLIDSIRDIGNDFEILSPRSYPDLGRIANALARAGADLTRMSGSGPTVFGLFDNVPEREDLLQITRGDWQVIAVRPITLPAWDRPGN